MKLAAEVTILVLAVCLAFGLGYAVAYNPVTANSDTAVLAVNGNRIPILPGTEVEIEIDEQDNRQANVHIAEAVGRSKGGDVYTTVDAFAEKFQLPAPELHMDGSYGKAGELVYTAKGLAAKGHMVVIFAGVLCVIAGVVIFAYWSKRTGIYIAAAGGVLILTGVLLERYPWVALLLPIAGIGLVVYVWWRARQGQRVGVTLRSIVGAIEEADEDVAAAVKTNLPHEPGDPMAKVVKAVVGKVKGTL